MYNFHGMYRYSPRYASNWRAVVAFFIGCIPPLPGFVNNIVVAGNGKTGVSIGGQHLFAIGYIYSFIAAGLFYWAFNKISPHTESMLDHAETGEDVIAANDAKNVEAARLAREGGRRKSLVATVFEV